MNVWYNIVPTFTSNKYGIIFSLILQIIGAICFRIYKMFAFVGTLNCSCTAMVDGKSNQSCSILFTFSVFHRFLC